MENQLIGGVKIPIEVRDYVPKNEIWFLSRYWVKDHWETEVTKLVNIGEENELSS